MMCCKHSCTKLCPHAVDPLDMSLNNNKACTHSRAVKPSCIERLSFYLHTVKQRQVLWPQLHGALQPFLSCNDQGMAACLWVRIIDDNTVIVDLQLWVLVPVPAPGRCDMANDLVIMSSHAHVVPHLCCTGRNTWHKSTQERPSRPLCKHACRHTIDTFS